MQQDVTLCKCFQIFIKYYPLMYYWLSSERWISWSVEYYL